MRSSLVPVVAAISLMALPAFAASTSSGTQPSTGDSQNAEATQNSGQIRQNLHQDLTQAGYTDIHIMPGSFLVHAKDKQGHAIEMMISPNSVLEVATVPESNSNMKTSSNTSTGNGSAGQANK
jgi:hypothetical protein